MEQIWSIAECKERRIWHVKMPIMKDEYLLQQEANSGSTWGWLFLVKSQEQQVRLP